MAIPGTDEGYTSGSDGRRFSRGIWTWSRRKYISITNANGVALAAIQILHKKLQILEEQYHEQAVRLKHWKCGDHQESGPSINENEMLLTDSRFYYGLNSLILIVKNIIYIQLVISEMLLLDINLRDPFLFNYLKGS